MKRGKVAVTVKVMEGLEAVRLSGKTNMLDAPMVVSLALDMGYPEAALWVSEHRNRYAQGIFRGFVPTENLEDIEPESTERIVGLEGGNRECVDR